MTIMADSQPQHRSLPTFFPKNGVAHVSPQPAQKPTLPQRLRNLMATGLSNSLGTREKTGFGILMYHRVVDWTRGVPEPTWNVTPKLFRQQLEGLLRRGFTPWPLRQVLKYEREGQSIPRQVFVVTFDDGYENVYTRAFPILSELKVPATLFLTTAYLDSSQPFCCDDWIAAGEERVPQEAWRPLRTEQCRAMQRSGWVELGAHTHTHDDFRNRPDALRQDLQTNLEELQQRFGLEDATFAFPFGSPSLGFAGPPLSDVAQEVGLLCSLTTQQKLVYPGNSPFDWGRFPAEQYDTSATLAAKLNGWYDALKGAWKRLTPFRRHS